MWTYLLVFDADFGDRRVQRFLDKHPQVYDWVSCLPYSYFLVSDLAASELTAEFQKLGDGRFIFIDTESDRNGRLPKSVWRMMKNPERDARPERTPDEDDDLS